jgi:hypothetical protein
MRKILLITFVLTIRVLIAQDTLNCRLLKTYKLNDNSLSSKVAAITIDSQFTFYTDRKSFLNFISKEFNSFKKFKTVFKEDNWYKRKYGGKDTSNFEPYRYNDTLYVNLSYIEDTSGKWSGIYNLEISAYTYNNKYYCNVKEKDTSEFEYETCTINPLRDFYYDCFDYFFQRIIRHKRLKIYNNIERKFEHALIKETFSYNYGPRAAGGGQRYRIKGTMFILRTRIHWIS